MKKVIVALVISSLTTASIPLSAIEHRALQNNPPVNVSPNQGYGLRLLPALWSKAAQNPTLAALVGGAALCGTGYALFSGLRNNPYTTLKLATAALALVSAGWIAATQTPPNLYFLNLEPTNLQAELLQFPQGFLFGTGGSAYQIEGVGPDNGGDDTSTYAPTWREKRLAALQKEKDAARKQGNKKEVDRLTKAHDDLVTLFKDTFIDPVGLACNEWNLYANDAALKASKGITADRFSIERFKVEPERGRFSKAAIEHYVNKAVTLVRLNIRPIIGMHHYTDPQWFMELGGFEKAENLADFVTYCATITKAIYEACIAEIAKKEAEAQANGQRISYHHLIPLFYTYNSANAYAINGYHQGIRPPYVKNLARSRTVLFNMLDAHVRAYKAMKNVAPLAKIGTTINLYQLDPVNYRNPLQRLLCFAGNYLQNYSVYDFFKQQKEQVLDWVGLNYYSHGYMKSAQEGPFSNPCDLIQTGSKLSQEALEKSCYSTANALYTIYADGLFLALHEINDHIAKPAGNIPIIITETGIGFNNVSPEETPGDIVRRELFLKHYLYATSQAYLVGIPVVGISIWSFMDNYEWGIYTKRYGLFGVDFISPEKKRIPRTSAEPYWQIIQKHTKKAPQIEL